MNRIMRDVYMILAVAAVALAMPSRSSAQEQASTMAWDWQTRPPAFNPVATPSQNPILLYFTADWCGFCKQMDRTTLADQTVRIPLAMLTHVKVDFDQQEDLVKQFGITGIPAFVLVNERGEEISRLVGAADSHTFLDWLNAGEKQAADVAQAAQKRRQELEQLVSEAASTDLAVRAGVKQRAFALAGRGDAESQQFATKYLHQMAETRPGDLLDGLADPDLAVRIAVANILRSKFGDDLGVDPWATARERNASISQLQIRLSGTK